MNIKNKYNIIKEMEYSSDFGKRELLANGICRGYNFYILNLGINPTAYIGIPRDSVFYKKPHGDLNIKVHGGLTYSSNTLYLENRVASGWFIGWDYMHWGDFNGAFMDMDIDMSDMRKWTVSDIIRDIEYVCEQLSQGDDFYKDEKHLFPIKNNKDDSE